MTTTKYKKMDSDRKSEQKSTGNDLSNDSDFSKPVRVRYFSLQDNSINERLLAYNVRALFVSIPIILFVLLIF
jgi:hypothetical protein